MWPFVQAYLVRVFRDFPYPRPYSMTDCNGHFDLYLSTVLVCLGGLTMILDLNLILNEM